AHPPWWTTILAWRQRPSKRRDHSGCFRRMINKNIAETLQKPAKRRQPSSIPLRIGALCLTSAVTAVNYTNYGPLIPVLRADLHINSGQAGLMSTLLFLGLAIMYIPAGALADRFGQRPVLIGSSILLAAGGVLLPLFPNFTWILFCRIIAGIGAGGAFVAGAGVAASMGKHSSLAQGLYGGSVQIGSGLGLLFTPLLYIWFGWRGAFLFWRAGTNVGVESGEEATVFVEAPILLLMP